MTGTTGAREVFQEVVDRIEDVLTVTGPGPAGPPGADGANAKGYATRAAMQAAAASATDGDDFYEVETGGKWVARAGNYASKVTADPDGGIYRQAGSISTSTLALVRQFDGPVYADWFGLAGDDTTNDGPKVLAILDLLDGNLPGYVGAKTLRFSDKNYYLGTSTLNIRADMTIEGVSKTATQLRWAANTNGIIIQGVNTADGLTGAVAAYTVGSANGAIIRLMTLKGGYAGTEGEYHGVALRWTANLADLRIYKFQGDGVWSRANAGDTTTQGSSSRSQLSNVEIWACRNGMYFDGGDANVISAWGCHVHANRQWGVWDSSFLGNQYFGCQSNANGWDGALGSIATGCAYAGNRYYVRVGQAAGASINAPSGTTVDNTWWGYYAAGGTYNGVPAWVSGTVFREGGSFKTDDPASPNLFIACYSEGDQNPSQMVPPSIVIGGLIYGGINGGAAYLGSQTTGALVAAQIGSSVRRASDGQQLGFVCGGSVNADQIATFGNDAFGSRNWSIKCDTNNIFGYVWANSQYAMAVYNTTGTDYPYHVLFPKGIRVGTTFQNSGSAAPTTGTYAQGDRVYNSAPAAGGKVGWVCTTGGWIASAAWAASHAYNVGNLVTNDTGKSYKCTTAGTSAASGGPTGTGSGITDGTAVWAYSAGFTFKAFGVIDA